MAFFSFECSSMPQDGQQRSGRLGLADSCQHRLKVFRGSATPVFMRRCCALILTPTGETGEEYARCEMRQQRATARLAWLPRWGLRAGPTATASPPVGSAPLSLLLPRF